jgi:hypothetical protein
MSVELLFLWLYWGCYVLLWYLYLVEPEDPGPLRVRVGFQAASAVAAVGMLLYLIQVVITIAWPVGWLVLLVAATATIANNIRWYFEIVRRPYPVPAGVKRMGAVFGCVMDVIVQTPCLVMLYRLARGIGLPTS